MAAALERTKPGLDLAEKLKPGSGWVAADVRVESDVPLSVSVEAGLKLSEDWSAYGDVWVQPTEKRAGGDVAARFKENLDIFAGGSAGLDGTWDVGAGVRWKF